MKNIYFLILFIGSFQTAFGQKIGNLEDFINPDTLLVKIVKQKSNIKKGENAISTELSYDFKHQYPYFIFSKTIETGDTLQFKVQHFPDTGFVYVYRLDAGNNIQLLDTLFMDEVSKLKVDSLLPVYQVITSTAGLERMVFLYAKNEIPEISRILKGIELTYGSFVLRHNGLFGNLILEPNMDWRMMEKTAGLSFEKKLLQSEKSWVLPLIIGFEVKEK